jgi:enolase
MATIKLVKARPILDSRGNPTVEVSFLLHHVICHRDGSSAFFFLCLFSEKKGNL